jgi:hypothetical protein
VFPGQNREENSTLTACLAPCDTGGGSMLLFAHEARVQMRGSQLLVLTLSVAIRPL